MARANVVGVAARTRSSDAQRERAELLRRVGLEELRAAVDGVHRLARAGVAGKALREWQRAPCRAARRRERCRDR